MTDNTLSTKENRMLLMLVRRRLKSEENRFFRKLGEMNEAEKKVLQEKIDELITLEEKLEKASE